MSKIARKGDRVSGICFKPGHGKGNPPVSVTNAVITSGSDVVTNIEGVATESDLVEINCGFGHTTTI